MKKKEKKEKPKEEKPAKPQRTTPRFQEEHIISEELPVKIEI